MRLFTLSLIFIVAIFALHGQQRISLWEGRPIPGNIGHSVADSMANERIYSVNHPSIDVYAPSKEENQNFAVLVIPGGAMCVVPMWPAECRLPGISIL